MVGGDRLNDPLDAESGYFVRVGSMGEVFPCRWSGAVPLRRGRRVVCRTGRGIELGRVVSPLRGVAANGGSMSSGAGTPGSILRTATTEDELLDARLVKHKQTAVRDCQQALAALAGETMLMDVEHLFDGRTLIFHFLGPVDEQIQGIVDRLVEVYENRARTSHFAKLMAEGCGPGCGTGEGGCGSGGCAVCVVRGACGAQKRETT